MCTMYTLTTYAVLQPFETRETLSMEKLQAAISDFREKANGRLHSHATRIALRELIDEGSLSVSSGQVSITEQGKQTLRTVKRYVLEETG